MSAPRSLCLLLTGFAHVALAQDWSVSASVSHAVDGEVDPRTGRPVLVQRFAASCTPPPGVGPPRYSSPGIVTLFASAPREEYPVSGPLGQVVAADALSGVMMTQSPVLGARVFPRMEVRCSSGLASPSAPLTVDGPALTTAPWVAPQVSVVPLEGADVGPDANQVPLGGLVRLLAYIESSPRGAERVTVHVEGPGVNVVRAYGAGDGDVTTAFNNDAQATFRATAPGEVRVWAEFEGLKSEVRALKVVGDASRRSMPGCSSAPLPVVALVMVLALRRGGAR